MENAIIPIDPIRLAEERSALANRILIWSTAGYLFLAAIKLMAGELFDSFGLTADGLLTLSSAVGCVMIMYGVKFSQRGRDERFPFGYGKVEFLVAFKILSALCAVGLFLCLWSAMRIFGQSFPAPQMAGLWVAILAVAVNLVMYWYSLRGVHELKTPGMFANASQVKADLLTALSVCAGILLSQLGEGFGVFDLLVAFLVGVLIVKDSYNQWRSNLDVLLDAAPQPHYKDAVACVVAECLPKKSLRFIKIRRTGARYWLGIGLDFPDGSSLAEAESALRALRALLCRRLEWVETVECFYCVSAE